MWFDYCEEEDMYRVKVVPCRGRIARALPFVGTSFTSAQLDAIAPVSKADHSVVAKQPNPPEHVQRHMNARIAAARKLKRGGYSC